MLGFTLRTIQHTTPLTTAQGSLILVSNDVSHVIIYWIFIYWYCRLYFLLCYAIGKRGIF